jgi:hypothetical protein
MLWVETSVNLMCDDSFGKEGVLEPSFNEEKPPSDKK